MESQRARWMSSTAELVVCTERWIRERVEISVNQLREYAVSYLLKITEKGRIDGLCLVLKVLHPPFCSVAG